MYMRLSQVKIKPEELATLRRFYDERVVPALQKTSGCLYACLMQSAQQPDEVISMTLWESQARLSKGLLRSGGQKRMKRAAYSRSS